MLRRGCTPEAAAQKLGRCHHLKTHRHTTHSRLSASLEIGFENKVDAQIVISSAGYATHKMLCSFK